MLSESLTLSGLGAKNYSLSRRPRGAIRFGDLGSRAKVLRFLRRLWHTCAATRYGSCARETLGSAGFRSRFANLRATATQLFGDD